MVHQGSFEVIGQVFEALPNTLFRVQLTDGSKILCHLSGKMRINYIKFFRVNQFCNFQIKDNLVNSRLWSDSSICEFNNYSSPFDAGYLNFSPKTSERHFATDHIACAHRSTYVSYGYQFVNSNATNSSFVIDVSFYSKE